MNYKDHFACFDCRKCFKHPRGTEQKCPHCRQKMVSMGLDFKAPPRKDLEAWKVLKTLSAYGFRFHSCGCGGPGYRPRTPRDLKAFLKQEHLKAVRAREVNHLLTR